MNLSKSELLILLGMVENVSERLEDAKVSEEAIGEIAELDYNLYDSMDHDIDMKYKRQDEVLNKIVKLILEK